LSEIAKGFQLKEQKILILKVDMADLICFNRSTRWVFFITFSRYLLDRIEKIPL